MAIRGAGIDVPIVFMGYYNNILSAGLDEYCSRVREAGVDGLIVADLPALEAGPLQDAADRVGLAVIPLLALTSTDEAIRHACARAFGFVYCISVLGVTGARATMSARVARFGGRYASTRTCTRRGSIWVTSCTTGGTGKALCASSSACPRRSIGMLWPFGG